MHAGSELHRFFLSSVFDALKVQPSGAGVGSVLASMWNWLVDTGHAIVKGVVDTITAPVRTAIQVVAGALGALSMAVANLAPWAVTIIPVTGQDDTVTLALPIDPEPAAKGSFLVSVDDGGVPDWPDTMKDCAHWADVDLPSLKPAGATVAWDPPAGGAGLLDFGTPETVLDDGGSARYPFTSQVEPKDHVAGEPQSAIVGVSARVLRPDVDKSLRRLMGALLAKLPSPIGSVVDKLVRPTLESLITQVTAMLDRRGTGSLIVTYHATPGWVLKLHTDNADVSDLYMEFDLHSCDGGDRWSGTFEYHVASDEDSTNPMSFTFVRSDRITAAVSGIMIDNAPHTWPWVVERTRDVGSGTVALQFSLPGQPLGPQRTVYPGLASPQLAVAAPAGVC